MMILVAGPYRSGTNDDPQRIQENLERLETTALELFHRGHLAVIGEWVTLPLMKRAGSKSIGDDVYNQFAYPASHRLLGCCDAVIRIEGNSGGADADVQLAQQLGMPVYYALDEVPAP